VLPPNYQPRDVLANLRNSRMAADEQRRQLDFTQQLNALHRQRLGDDNALNTRIESLELAFRMQASAEEAFDIASEPPSVHELYGITGEHARLTVNTNGGFSGAVYARNCLLARRLVERGVRVVQIYCGNLQPWDTHSKNSEGHQRLAQAVDRPIAALLQDLKQRGLLDDTLVIWGGEFGRTPASEGGNGRDHNHYGFSIWLAGGGVKGGMAYGTTDEFGFQAVENRVHVHDLHATMLHLMGLDHEKLTYRYSGRDFRLTDVHGRVVKEIIA
jgi:membrane-anchored protein YejM (alkaline phosphatase superfamily)